MGCIGGKTESGISWVAVYECVSLRSNSFLQNSRDLDFDFSPWEGFGGARFCTLDTESRNYVIILILFSENVFKPLIPAHLTQKRNHNHPYLPHPFFILNTQISPHRLPEPEPRTQESQKKRRKLTLAHKND